MVSEVPTDEGAEKASDSTMVAFVGQFIKLQEELGLPDAFVIGLPKEDDWSFVIRSSALLKGALTQLINTALNQERLDDIIEKLNIRGQTGKTAIAKALRLAEPAHLNFIEKLAELGNRLVPFQLFVPSATSPTNLASAASAPSLYVRRNKLERH